MVKITKTLDDKSSQLNLLQLMSTSRTATASRLISLTRQIEVKYHGQYSPQRLQELVAFQGKTSTAQAIGILGLSLLPCIAITTLVDAIPLEPPRNPINHSPRFLLRLFGSIWIFTMISLVQFRHYVKALQASTS